MIRLLLAVTCSLCLFACKGDKPAPGASGSNPGGTSMPDDEHGERKPLGQLTVAGHGFEVIQFGDMTPGMDGAIDLEWPTGKERPATVRAWVGIESGEGSMKARLAKEGDRVVHGHVEVPKPLPAGSKLWIEIEDGDAKGQGSVAFK